MRLRTDGIELKKIEYKGEHVVLLGDMNKHVGDLVEGLG